MKRHKTKAIVLKRTNFGDADRVLSLLTEKYGRISAVAKGVRRSGAKMAAGVEPFTVSDVDFINGRGSMSTLVSARPNQYFKQLAKEYERSVVAGEMLKLLNELIEDDVDSSYFELAEELLFVMDDKSIDADVAETWFRLQLLGLLGRQPNLLSDSDGKDLDENSTYHFDPDEGNFFKSDQGGFDSAHIKAWRVLSLKSPRGTKNIKGLTNAVETTLTPLKQFMANNSF